MLKTDFYVTTTDEKNHAHHYRLANGEAAPAGHEITNVRVASRYTLASLVSPDGLATLKFAGRLNNKLNRR